MLVSQQTKVLGDNNEPKPNTTHQPKHNDDQASLRLAPPISLGRHNELRFWLRGATQRQADVVGPAAPK